MNRLVKASKTKDEFYDLIGTEVTFDCDIVFISGALMHAKGEKAVISDVEYTQAFFSNFFLMHVPAKISSFRINGVDNACWSPKTFVEFSLEN